MKFDFKKPETSLCHALEVYFDILNRVGVAHECDRRTDGHTERPLATARCNSDIRALKI